MSTPDNQNGRILRGAATIPSKHQQSIPSVPMEKKGFGSRSTRFRDPADANDRPGPGSYGMAMEKEFKPESMSRKGYGNLASRSQRFSTRTQYTGPGPGEYRQPIPSAVHVDSTHLRGGGTAAFQLPKSSAVHRAPAGPMGSDDDSEGGESSNRGPCDATPGPGSYNPEGTTRNGDVVNVASHAPWKHSSAFKAVPRPENFGIQADSTPSAAAYQQLKEWSVGERSNTQFRKGSQRRPPPIMKATTYVAVLLQQEINTAGPGPGSYDINKVVSLEADLAHASHKSKHRAPIDRFGRPRAKTAHPAAHSSPNPQITPPPAPTATPGPGAYSPDAKPFARAPGGASSAFVSSVQQHSVAGTSTQPLMVPGPAFYKAEKQGKKSFHLNAHGRFLS